LTEIKILNFPLTNYKYLKFVIDDHHNGPINVLKAGYYKSKQVIRNKDKKAFDNLTISMTGIKKECVLRLSGSDDKRTWSVIKSDYEITKEVIKDQYVNIKLSDLPKSDYEYYKLEITGRKRFTPNITHVGYYDIIPENEKLLNITTPEITQIDSPSTKTTYVKISFDHLEYIDKLKLDIEGPMFYRRKAKLCILKKVQTKKREEKVYFRTIRHIELISGQKNNITFSNYPANEFYLIIENNDNEPLKIKSVHAFQLKHFITAFLEHDKQYALKFGNENLGRPVYDLAYFKQHIPKDPPDINTAIVTDITKEKFSIVESFLNKKEWIWVAIVLVISLLGLLSVNMIKDMGVADTAS